MVLCNADYEYQIRNTSLLEKIQIYANQAVYWHVACIMTQHSTD